MTKRVIGGAKGIPPVDVAIDLTGVLASIDSSHHEIHEGNHFICNHEVTLTDEQIYYIKFATGDKYTHLYGNISSSGGISVVFYEDSTGGMTGGDDCPKINSNRVSTKVSVCTVTKGVAAPVTPGTAMYTRTSGGGTGVLSQPGIVSREDEFVLKKNSVYLFKVTSNSLNNIVDMLFNWYEL